VAGSVTVDDHAVTLTTAAPPPIAIHSDVDIVKQRDR